MFIFQIFAFLTCIGIINANVDINVDGTISKKSIKVYNHFYDEINVMLHANDDADWIMNVGGKGNDIFDGEVGDKISCPRVYDEELNDVFTFTVTEDTTEVHVGRTTNTKKTKSKSSDSSVSGTPPTPTSVTIALINTLEYDYIL